MAIKDWNGTTTYETKKATDWNGTTITQLGKGWDWNGTSSTLFYQFGEVKTYTLANQSNFSWNEAVSSSNNVWTNYYYKLPFSMNDDNLSSSNGIMTAKIPQNIRVTFTCSGDSNKTYGGRILVNGTSVASPSYGTGSSSYAIDMNADVKAGDTIQIQSFIGMLRNWEGYLTTSNIKLVSTPI